MKRAVIADLERAVEEKFVEGAYRGEISRLRGCEWVTPDIRASVDGYAEWKNTRFLLEAKLEENLKSRRDACNVLAQAVFYIRRFMDAGQALPTVVMIADKNECFVVATAALEKHTQMQRAVEREREPECGIDEGRGSALLRASSCGGLRAGGCARSCGCAE